MTSTSLSCLDNSLGCINLACERVSERARENNIQLMQFLLPYKKNCASIVHIKKLLLNKFKKLDGIKSRVNSNGKVAIFLALNLAF